MPNLWIHVGVDQVEEFLGLHIRITDNQFYRWLGNNAFNRGYSKSFKRGMLSVDFIDYIQLIQRILGGKACALHGK